ncbi:hypothetical protein [Luteipulveratus halotolerans]|nr:hypothetical protein [Luteipulveratus halotolerans]
MRYSTAIEAAEHHTDKARARHQAAEQELADLYDKQASICQSITRALEQRAATTRELAAAERREADTRHSA